MEYCLIRPLGNRILNWVLLFSVYSLILGEVWSDRALREVRVDRALREVRVSRATHEVRVDRAVHGVKVDRALREVRVSEGGEPESGWF